MGMDKREIPAPFLSGGHWRGDGLPAFGCESRLLPSGVRQESLRPSSSEALMSSERGERLGEVVRNAMPGDVTQGEEEEDKDKGWDHVGEQSIGSLDFTRMSKEEKRKHYVCGSKFVTLSDIPTWSQLHSANPQLKERIEIKRLQFALDEELNDKVSLWRGDITHLEIEAIVSSSSEDLTEVGEVGIAIDRAASDGLWRDCMTLERHHGEAVLTGGYQLPAKYVLHAMGSPNLCRCYTSCLELVLKHNIRSVAFPCLGTGTLGFPHDESAWTALTTTRIWLERYRDKVDRIIFCVFQAKDYVFYKKYLCRIFPFEFKVPLSDEKAQQIIDEALESSSVDMRNVVSVVTGLMGSGKTWLLSRLFNQLPPDLYTSTGLAEQSVRGLLHHLVNVSFPSWEPFSHRQILEFLVCLFHKNPSAPDAKNVASTTAISTLSTPSPGAYSSLPAPPLSTKSATIQSMVELVKAPKFSQSLAILELVHMIDTGGQPELLDDMPSLIHHSHLAVLVLNLTYGLDEHPSIDYHEEGRVYRRALTSRFSSRQIMQKLSSTLQAKRFSLREGQCFRMLVVATHRDCVLKDELQARVKAFDRALRAILLPSSDEELICFSASQIPFVLNLKDPEIEDMNRLDLIRKKVSESEVGEMVKTPGSFLVFEQELEEFAKQGVHRDILSLDECLLVGARLRMTPEVVEAALIFFHRQFTLLYFRHVLPDLVFTRPQTLLDCINAVVRFSYKVGSGQVKGVTEKLVSSLRDGIITEEILRHKELSQSFIPGLYEPHHAIDLLCHTFTLAPLSGDVQSTPDTSCPATSQPTPSIKREKREYLMMSLRPAIPDKELPRHLSPPSKIAPLLVRFTKDCVPLSCFGRTIACLLAMYDWKLSRASDRSPQCLAHNIVSLYKPRSPGQIFLADMGHSFQVHVNIGGDTNPACFSKVCFQVRETIFAAINQVFESLHLAKIEVSPAFLCPCPSQPRAHAASAYHFESQWLLHCSVAEKDVGEAQSWQNVWLDAPVVEQERPTLPKLFKLKIPQKVGANFVQFGVLLLDDGDGMMVESLRVECLGNCERIVSWILREWVMGKGLAVTWKTLKDTLRECGLASLADHIDH